MDETLVAEEPERFWLVKEIAQMYRVHESKVRRMFASEEGVVVFRKNRRCHLRVPDRVLRRVFGRLTVS